MVEGVAVHVYVGGQIQARQVIDVRPGPPLFVLPGPGAVAFKNVKAKVGKTA